MIVNPVNALMARERVKYIEGSENQPLFFQCLGPWKISEVIIDTNGLNQFEANSKNGTTHSENLILHLKHCQFIQRGTGRR